jgi:drug/metabolite transporter (DMT)-like permease
MSTATIARQGAGMGLWALLIGSESVAQIAMKLGSSGLADKPLGLDWLTTALSSPGVLVAITCYVCSFFIWMLILRITSLSKAFPLSSVVFVTVLLASWLGLGEHISTLHWIGVMVIVAGIAVMAEGGEGEGQGAPGVEG